MRFWHGFVSSRRGGSVILELIISLGLITVTIFLPVALFALNHKANLLLDVLTTGIQMMAVDGGLTDRVEEVIYRNMEAKGLLPPNSTAAERAMVVLVSNADARDGHTERLKYRNCESDNLLELEIRYPAKYETGLINALSRMIGAGPTQLPFGDSVEWYYVFKGYILSEKIPEGGGNPCG